MQTMIIDAHLQANDLKDYALKIEKFKENGAGLQEAFRMEYAMFNNTKEQSNKEPDFFKYFYASYLL